MAERRGWALCVSLAAHAAGLALLLAPTGPSGEGTGGGAGIEVMLGGVALASPGSVGAPASLADPEPVEEATPTAPAAPPHMPALEESAAELEHAFAAEAPDQVFEDASAAPTVESLWEPKAESADTPEVTAAPLPARLPNLPAAHVAHDAAPTLHEAEASESTSSEPKVPSARIETAAPIIETDAPPPQAAQQVAMSLPPPASMPKPVEDPIVPEHVPQPPAIEPLAETAPTPTLVSEKVPAKKPKQQGLKPKPKPVVETPQVAAVSSQPTPISAKSAATPSPAPAADAASAASTSSAATSAESATSAASGAQLAARGPASTEIGRDERARYLAQLRAWLEKHKRYPRRAQMGRIEGTAMLSFVVDSQGRVLQHALERTSGHAVLDAEVEAMLQRAAPLPPLPAATGLDRLEVTVPVEFVLR